MRRRRIPPWALAWAALLALAWPGLAAAQAPPPAATPFVPTLAGHRGIAARSYDARPFREAGPASFLFAVAAFDTPAQAAAALAAAVARMRADPANAAVAPAAADALGDEARAFAGRQPSADGAFTFRVAYLYLRDARYAHTWAALGLGDDPLPDLLAVARRRLARAPAADAGLAGLLGRLPDGADLPPGYALADEHLERPVGTPPPAPSPPPTP